MSNLKIPLGRFDNPEKQEQKDYHIDLYHSNLAVFGSSMSGKTVLIKTLLLHIHNVLKLTSEKKKTPALCAPNCVEGFLMKRQWNWEPTR